MSTSLYFSSELAHGRLRSGAIAGHIDGFAAWLAEQGYSRRQGRAKLRLTGALSRWLAERALDLTALDEAQFGAFLAASSQGLESPEATGRQLLSWLRANGLLAPVAITLSGCEAPMAQIKERMNASCWMSGA